MSPLQRPLYEDIDLGTIVIRVSATDADSGLFAVIEYSLVDGEGKFGIRPSSVSTHTAACMSARTHTHTHMGSQSPTHARTHECSHAEQGRLRKCAHTHTHMQKDTHVHTHV